MNVTTLIFAGLCVLNVCCNLMMGVLYFFISLFNHTGDWFRISDANDRYYILMSVIIYASFGLTVLFTKWIRPVVLKLEGKYKLGMFVFLPVMFILNSLSKAGNVTEYKANPSGMMLAFDFAAGIITCICVMVIVVLKIREQKAENGKVENYLETVKKEYDDMARTENELRTIKHEIKNQIIEDEK